MTITNKLRIGILSFTSTLVVLLGILVFFSLLSKGPVDPDSLTSNGFRTPAAIVAVSGRSLQDVDPADQKMGKFDIQCFKPGQNKSFSVNVKQIRLIAGSCGQGFKDAKITNRTNGFLATTFKLPGNRFTTDYIYLAEGENKIFVTMEDEQGQNQLAELKITREILEKETN